MKFRDYVSSRERGSRTASSSRMEESTRTTSSSINEVAFSDKRILKVTELYSKILSKSLAGAFKYLGLETYKRSMGPGKGFRYMNNKGEMLRFNWDEKLAKKTQSDLTSIDYWADGNINFEKPTRTITFGSDLNVLQVLSKIGDALKTGNINESIRITNEINMLLEKKSRAEKQDWLEDKGMPRWLLSNKDKLASKLKDAGLTEEFEIFSGEEEENSFEGEFKESKKKLDTQVYANPDTVFEDVEDLLSLIAAGKWRTMVVCGQGGIGKTYHITEGDRSLKELLGSEGDKWTYHSGTKAAPFSFYKTLFQERNKIIVFDESDSLLKNDDIIMMLKPILDTSGDNFAEYMAGTQNMVGMSKDQIKEYCNEVDEQIANGAMIGSGKKDVKLPSKFQFEGGMIFISNMKSTEIEQAIMSRSIFIDIYLAERDILKRIKSIGYAKAKKSGGSISQDDIDDVLSALGESNTAPTHEITYMTPAYARKSKQVTVRALTLGLILKQSGLARWAELTALYA